VKEPRLHLVLALLAGCVVYWVWDLGRRLHGIWGLGALWHLLRTLGLWAIGLLDTALARPERIGAWRSALGWTLLAVAALDSVTLYRKERSRSPDPGSAATGSDLPSGSAAGIQAIRGPAARLEASERCPRSSAHAAGAGRTKAVRPA
jgi:hypothetical protein